MLLNGYRYFIFYFKDYNNNDHIKFDSRQELELLSNDVRMSNLNLVYTSAQDQLLIMLLERITSLEDVISKQSATLLELVSISTSDVFTVYITGKYNNQNMIVGGDYEDITKVKEQILSIINNIVPCHNIYAHLNPDSKGGSLALHTRDRHILLNLQTMLNAPLSRVVNLNCWQMQSPMDILKNTDYMKKFTQF